MRSRQAESFSTVRGSVVCAYWDRDADTMRVAVVTRDGHEIEVLADRRGRDLAEHLHDTVEVRGPVRCDLAGRWSVRVVAFTVLSGDAEGSSERIDLHELESFGDEDDDETVAQIIRGSVGIAPR